MLDRRYVRDWRGRFARVASTKTKARPSREKMAASLYAKRSEQMVANKALYDRSNTIKVGPVTHSTTSAEFIARAKLTHERAMHHINQMTIEARKEWGQKSIRHDAQSEGEARLIFRIKHGNRVELNGFDGQYYDRQYTLQALHTMDVLLTKYPEVQIDAFNTKEPNYFGADPPMAWAQRDPREMGADGRPWKIAIELNDMYLNFPDRMKSNEDAVAINEFTHTDVRSQEDGEETDFGAMGMTVAHEFGHLMDFTAYQGQWYQRHGWMNSTTDYMKVMELAQQILDLREKLKPLLTRHGQLHSGPPTVVAERAKDRAWVEEVAALMDEIRPLSAKVNDLMLEMHEIPNKWDNEKWPTLEQGRNGSIRKAIERAYNRSIGRKESAPISKKDERIWDGYRAWLIRQSSNYSVKPERMAPPWQQADNRTRRQRESGPMDFMPNRTGTNMIQKRQPIAEDGEIWWNYTELLAESFADAEANGSRAQPISREIHAQLVWQLEQGNGGIKAAFQGTKKKGKKK